MASSNVTAALAPKPFLWGSDGKQLSPEEAAARRSAADRLRAPEGYTPEGFMSLLGALAGEGVGQFKENQAVAAETFGHQSVADALAKARETGDYMSVMSDPWVTPQQSSVAGALQGRAWSKEDQAAQWAREDSRAAQAAKASRKPIEINGQLVDPDTLKVIGDFRTPPAAGGANFDDVSGIRKEVQGLPSYKNYAQALPIYKSMEETSSRNSRASDLNLVYGLGKIMDPTSVVREGEMVMVQNTASLPDWLVGTINSLNGGAGLTPTTRDAIMTEAYGRMKGYEGAFSQDADAYRGLANRYAINPDDILPSLAPVSPYQPLAPSAASAASATPAAPMTPTTAPPAAPAVAVPPSVPAAAAPTPAASPVSPSPQPAMQPVVIASDADYDALASGALFIGPDGVKRIKP